MFRKHQKPRTRLGPLADRARPLPDVEPRPLTDEELRDAGGAMINSAPGHIDEGGTHVMTESQDPNGIYHVDYD